MSAQKILPLFFICLFFLFSCTPITESQVKKTGWTHLTAKKIFSLFSDNSIQLRASNFSGKLFFKKDGHLAAKDYENNIDTGIWNVNKENQLCLKFDQWYFSDVRCFSVYTKENEDSYTLFAPNGAFYSTAQLFSGDPDKLISLLKDKKRVRYLRNTFSEDQVDARKERGSEDSVGSVDIGRYSPNDDEMKHSFKTMAQDCPGCNLEGVDLRKATLIGANLEGARLKKADMSRANLRRANLKDADLSGALLINANLPGADLRNSNLQGCDLTGANLIKADLTGADIAGAIFTNAHLEAVKGNIEKP